MLHACYTLLPDRPVQSNTISNSLGSIQPRINWRLFVYSQLSFTQLSELDQCRVKKLAQVQHVSTGFKPGYLILVKSLKLYSHCTSEVLCASNYIDPYKEMFTCTSVFWSLHNVADFTSLTFRSFHVTVVVTPHAVVRTLYKQPDISFYNFL